MPPPTHSLPGNRDLELQSLEDWPALTTLRVSGWQYRFAGGFTRRVNSVQANTPLDIPLEEAIAACEAAARGQGLPTVFRLHPHVHPGGLDGVLAARGYAQEGETAVQTLALTAGAAGSGWGPSGTGATVLAGWRGPWLTAFLQVSRQLGKMLPRPGAPGGTGTTPPPPGQADPGEMMAAILGKIPGAQGCALITGGEGEPLALGRAVCTGPRLGVYDILTHPGHRGRGLGRLIMEALLAWGLSQGARWAYLAVEADNRPALALYHRLGFREAYRYWYRVQPPGPSR